MTHSHMQCQMGCPAIVPKVRSVCYEGCKAVFLQLARPVNIVLAIIKNTLLRSFLIVHFSLIYL